jgi:carboxylate-amine ligase
MASTKQTSPLGDRLEPSGSPRWSGSEPLGLRDFERLLDERSSLTVGLEEELMLLDPDTLELAPAAGAVLELLGPDERFGHELREGQIELRTPVSGNAVAAGISLAEARLRLCEHVRGTLLVAGAGTHPFSASWGGVPDDLRYGEIVQEFPHAVAGHLPCGFHVHVAVPGAARALAVFNAARSYLPVLSALSANSPFLDGRATGLSSSRSQIFFAGHRVGVPPAFGSWRELVDFVEWGRHGGLFPNASHLWWDLRPHPRYGTLELRSPDTLTRVEDAVAVAAVFHALVAWLADRVDDGETLAVHDTTRIAENVWRATRYGTRGTMVDLDTGDPEDTRMVIGRLLGELEATAARQGAGWALLTARSLLADNAADRQLYVERERGVRGLVEWLAAETVSSAQEYLELPR